MDLALAIEKLVPSAEYFGTTFDNTEGSFDALIWTDKREKPTWEELVDAWYLVQEDLQAKEAAKEASRAKLEALGLTVDDLKNLGI